MQPTTTLLLALGALLATSVRAGDGARRRGGGGVEVVDAAPRRRCTVYAHGGNASDVPSILSAFARCGHGGTIVFPEDQNYLIASKLNPVVRDVTIEWRGTWTMSPDIAYWRQPAHHYPIAFQNHAASFVLTGDGIRIDGHGTGGIHGNGDVWYTAEAGVTQPGRPMPFVLWNVSAVRVTDFAVRDPPLWAINVMNGTDLRFTGIRVNATATRAPPGANWVQNTDGFDTMDAENVVLTDFTYQGGDDCVAIKPRSRNVRVRDVLCRGGNGIAVGSLGQYPGVDASVEDVVVERVTVRRHNDDLHNSAYIKTWVGAATPQASYESAGAPNGGGRGRVRNVLFADFRVEGADAGPAIAQDSGGPADGSLAGSSLLEVSNVAFVNFTGYLAGPGAPTRRTASVSCSRVRPCYNIVFEGVNVTVAENATATGTATCAYTSPGGVHGICGGG